MKKVKIETEYIKLDQLLKFSGVLSTGGQGKILIKQGYVKLNGEIITERGKKIKKGDEIEIKDMGKILVL